MVEFCTRHGIPHEVCGKLIVATNSRKRRDWRIYSHASGEWVGGSAAVARERCWRLNRMRWCASAACAIDGITDYAAVTAKYAEIATQHGAEVRTGAEWWDLTVREARLEARQATQWWCGLGREILRRGMW